MSQTIFAVKPISKQMKGGKALYGVQLITSESESKSIKKVWKSLQQYCALQKQISQIAFDFERTLDKELNKATTDQQKLKLVTDFMNECKSRNDVSNLLTFRSFCNIGDCDFDCLNEWKRINVEVKDMVVADFAWDPYQSLLITLHKPKSKAKKITNFFKQLLSKQTHLGAIRVYKLKQQWELLHQTIPEAQPNSLEWNNKSNLLFVSSDIGIYVYTLTFHGQKLTQSLIDFAKIYNVKDFKYAPKSGCLYAVTPQRLYVYSVSKQFTMQINPHPFKQATSLAFDKSESRLYLSENNALRIYDICDYKNVKQIVKLEDITGFKVMLCHASKYLFGVTNFGYASVFEIKPTGKEYLTNTLTNIDCPEHTTFFSFNERGQMIITSNNEYIVLVSSKNVPLFAGGSHKAKITAGLFDNESNVIVTADEENNIIFYNLSMLRNQLHQ